MQQKVKPKLSKSQRNKPTSFSLHSEEQFHVKTLMKLIEFLSTYKNVHREYQQTVTRSKKPAQPQTPMIPLSHRNLAMSLDFRDRRAEEERMKKRRNGGGKTRERSPSTRASCTPQRATAETGAEERTEGKKERTRWFLA